MRKESLAGSVLERWLSDGKPSLSWADLVQRTIQADVKLESIGLNPARVFRRHRQARDTTEMERYVAGFYEYEFSPNYNPRKRAKSSDRVEVPPLKTVSVVKPIEPRPHSDLLRQTLSERAQASGHTGTEPISKSNLTSGSEEQLKPGTLDLADGQTGISYEKIFGPYLRGAKSVTLVDPYIRFDYQIRNLMEFCRCLSPETTTELEIITTVELKDDEFRLVQKLDEIKQSLHASNINFKYQIDNRRHDREIRADNGWRIILGRGLDIFQRPSGRFSLDNIDQSHRRCKATTITYLRT
jgi:Phospholipase D-like domain at C-terminus of MIT